jgi:hypothetical protein
MACETYKEVNLNSCLSEFGVKGLPADINLIWTLEDKFGKIYSGEVTSDSDGQVNIVIEAPLSPDMLREFSGSYKLRFTTEDRTHTRVCTQYDYLMLSFVVMQPAVVDPIIINACES